MCELFAMSSRYPATVTFSLGILAEHGCHTAENKDGWGIAYYDDNDVQLIRDTSCASDSRWVRFIEREEINSTLVLSHIRLATEGDVSLKNTQPFCRELGGRMHVFAHNGHLPRIRENARFTRDAYRPVGETDSEYAFCALLERIKPLWRSADEFPNLLSRIEIVAEFAADLRSIGLSNFLYCDGEVIFAHGDRRKQADGEYKSPGLYFLRRDCAQPTATMDDAGVSIVAPNQAVFLVASVPLSNEAWEPFGEGELISFSSASLNRRLAPAH